MDAGFPPNCCWCTAPLKKNRRLGVALYANAPANVCGTVRPLHSSERMDGGLADTATRRLMCSTNRCCLKFTQRRIPAVSMNLQRGYATEPFGARLHLSIKRKSSPQHGWRLRSINLQILFSKMHCVRLARPNYSGALCTRLVAFGCGQAVPLRSRAGFLSGKIGTALGF